MVRNLLLATSLGSLIAFASLGGCGSSSGGNDNGGGDGGSSSGGSSGSSSGSSSSGSSSGGSSSGGSSGSSSGGGSSSGSSSGGDSGGAGTCTSPVTPTASEVPKYTPVNPIPGACSETSISSFVTDCDSKSATMATCTKWQMDSSNKSCLECLGQAKDDGAALVNDSSGTEAVAGYNFAGCVALEDKANGAACAAALEPLLQCENIAGCTFNANECTTQSALDTCVQTACGSYAKAADAACKTDEADGGVLTSGKCSTVEDVITVICGGSSGDAGGKDSGKKD